MVEIRCVRKIAVAARAVATFRRKNDAPLRGDFSGRTGICCTIVPDLMT
jgi:hypothetical protein